MRYGLIKFMSPSSPAFTTTATGVGIEKIIIISNWIETLPVPSPFPPHTHHRFCSSPYIISSPPPARSLLVVNRCKHQFETFPITKLLKMSKFVPISAASPIGLNAPVVDKLLWGWVDVGKWWSVMCKQRHQIITRLENWVLSGIIISLFMLPP